MIKPLLKRLILLLALVLSTVSFVFSPPAAYSPDVLERINKVEGSLAGNNRIERSPMLTLNESMDFHGVPGLTVGVISGCELDWAKAYGMANKELNVPAPPASLFQAGPFLTILLNTLCCWHLSSNAQ
jgi:hypothetical protein